MGWLVKYTGPDATVDVPGKGSMDVKTGDTFDLFPPAVRDLVRDPGQPWQRVMPYDPEYVPAGER